MLRNVGWRIGRILLLSAAEDWPACWEGEQAGDKRHSARLSATIAQESPVKTRPIVRLLIFVKFSDAPAAVGGGKLFIA